MRAYQAADELIARFDALLQRMEDTTSAWNQMTEEERSSSNARYNKYLADWTAAKSREVESKAKAKLASRIASIRSRLLNTQIRIAEGAFIQIGTILEVNPSYRMEVFPGQVRAVFYYDILLGTKDGRKIWKALKPF